ncbi:unnamed protein product [Triticum aestivum]|uniref:Transposase (putative) gypsy type domain-containing protein n=1 Tax=Triticum aestivum TaxID=4565 RepID=A0A7H4LHJ5_WHEAT|nr:unnamed protein product [Triticum aestivum]
MPPKAPKAPITCNWVRSNVTDSTLADFVKTSYLPKKEVMSYRAPDPSEERPQPKDGEVVIFADHMSRGLAPPGSKFLRDVLHFFDLRPQDIGPNSVSNICNFQVFCEVYLGDEPSLLLFRELFYLNRQNECANGPSLELGGISIQRRRDCLFPYAEPPSHPKDWNQTWFYCHDTSPTDENPLPGFRALRLESNHPLPDKLSQAERQPLIPTINKIKALLGNGLNGIDLVRVWIAWRVIPLSRRPGLMCDYTGRKDDPLRHSPDDLHEDVIDDMTKSLLNESLADCGRTGLSPFCKANPAPAANDKFWKVRYDHEAAKKARKVKKAARKAAPRKKGSKPSASDLLHLEDTSESEEDTGRSHEVIEEVTIISSDSEPLPRLKVRRVTRKVRFSHPLAYQDPQFLLKRQIHENRRQTRTSKDADLSSGLPEASRKRRTEVNSDLYPFHPLAGVTRQPLNSSDSNYQGTSPSSGDSMQSSLPAFKTAPGVQVKPSKRAEKNKPAEDPVLTEPDASAHEPPSAPAPETTTAPSDEQVMEGSDNPEIPSPAHLDDPDVVITRTEFVELGRPTMLARCSAKEELLERCRARLDITDYANLSIGDIVSGYINQVHNSRDLEIDMVKKIQQKSEAACQKFESEISDLKNRLKTQESETQKANSKFEFSVSAQEKLKKKFEAERKAWADEKTSLLSRAEQAEAALTERTAELSGLKRHVSQMALEVPISIRTC